MEQHLEKNMENEMDTGLEQRLRRIVNYPGRILTNLTMHSLVAVWKVKSCRSFSKDTRRPYRDTYTLFTKGPKCREEGQTLPPNSKPSLSGHLFETPPFSL